MTASKAKKTKTSFQIALISLVAFGLLGACTKSKEERMKDVVGMAKDPANADPVGLADKTPTFDNEIAAGMSLVQSRQYEKALAYFEKAAQHNPNSAIAQNNLCSTYNNLENWNKAIPYCEKALQITADFQLAKNNLKYSNDQKAAQAKRISDLKAKADTTKGAAKRPILVDLGHEYYKMQDYEEAVKAWKKVEKGTDDLMVRTLNNLGSAYILLKKYDLAQEALDQAGQLDPKNQLVKNNQAWLKSASQSK